MSEQLLSPEALAEMCDVPVGTVYRWNYTGSGPTPIRVGRHTRYRRADVDAWLEQNELHLVKTRVEPGGPVSARK